MVVTPAQEDSSIIQRNYIENINEYGHNIVFKHEGNLERYLSLFLKAVKAGAIETITVDGDTYEVYADLLETSE